MAEPTHASDGAPAPTPPAPPFEDVYRDHREAVYRFCLARLRTPELAEDLCEDVFVSAFSAYRQAAVAPDEVRSWLMRIARNAVIDHWRRVGRRSRVTNLWRSGESSEVSVEQSVMARSDLRLVLEAMTHLRSRERELVSLRAGAGLTYVEIASVMRMSEEGVRRATQRAIAKLQAALGDTP